MDRDDVGAGELLRVRVARGDFGVRPVSDATSAAKRATRQPAKRTPKAKPTS